MAKACKVEGCITAADKDMGEGFCTDHSNEWRSSQELHEAMQDEGVRFAAGLRIRRMLTTALRPYKKMWLKRIGHGEEG